MVSHILPKSPETSGHELALAIILTPPGRPAQQLIARHQEGPTLFVLVRDPDTVDGRSTIFHAFITEDQDSYRISIEDEDDFPSSAECPISLLDKADPPRTEKASSWRSVCRMAGGLKQRPPPLGARIRFSEAIATEDGCSETDFTFSPQEGCRGCCFISRLTGRRHAVPYFLDRAYEVAA